MTASPLQSGEHIIQIVPQHWIRFVLPSVLYVLLLCVSIGLFLVAGYSYTHSAALMQVAFGAGFVLFLVNHHWFFIFLLSEVSSQMIITNRRVVWMQDHLFVDERMAEYAFEKMKSVEAIKHGILQTVLRYGTLRFEHAPDIPLVPHPNRVAKHIEQAIGLR